MLGVPLQFFATSTQQSHARGRQTVSAAHKNTASSRNRQSITHQSAKTMLTTAANATPISGWRGRISGNLIAPPLCQHTANKSRPSAVLFSGGDAALEGARIIVSGPNGAKENSPVLSEAMHRVGVKKSAP